MGRRPGGKIPVPPREELERLYITENKTQQQLADIYKVSASKMQKWIAELEITKEPATISEYIQLYEDFTNSGETLANYGARLNLSAQTLWYRVTVGQKHYSAQKRAKRKEKTQ